jgi:para-nitrobenzyl esterase
MYLFTWESPFRGGILKSCHTLEMPFVFNNVEPIVLIGDSPDPFKLAAAFSGAWLAFARTGNPNHPGIPRWPTYDKVKRATMIFNTECRVENDPRGEERAAWDDIR